MEGRRDSFERNAKKKNRDRSPLRIAKEGPSSWDEWGGVKRGHLGLGPRNGKGWMDSEESDSGPGLMTGRSTKKREHVGRSAEERFATRGKIRGHARSGRRGRA